MQTTFQWLVVLVAALFPGAVYTWSFERLIGRWDTGPSDRLYRFFALSALFQGTGDFVRNGDDLVPVRTYGVLVRWSEVEYLEVSE